VHPWFGSVGLSALVILSLCFIVPERASAQTEQHPQSATQGEKGSCMSDSVAVLALCLMGVLAASTIGLWYLTWRGDARQAAETTKFQAIAADVAKAGRSAADAANACAAALVSIERAYLFIDEEVDFDLVGDSSATTAEEPGSSDKPNYMIKFTFINRGRTPAILESISMGVTPSLQQPTKLDAAMLTLRASVPVGSVISANSRYERRLGCPFRLEQAVRKQVEQRQARLYFLGRIGYKDIFGNGHETGFGLEFEPNSQTFMRVLSDELNYYT
jgi:hypothetical protein